MDVGGGLRSDGLTTLEYKELRELRREVNQLKLEQELLDGPRPVLPGSRSPLRSLGIRGAHQAVSDPGDVEGARGLVERLLRVAREVAAIFQAPGLGQARNVVAGSKTRRAKELLEAVEVLGCGFGAATQFHAIPRGPLAAAAHNQRSQAAPRRDQARIRAARAFPDRASALRLVIADLNLYTSSCPSWARDDCTRAAYLQRFLARAPARDAPR
jgi:hypothetical protein